MAPVWRIRLLILVLSLIAAVMGYLYFTQRLTPEERLAAELQSAPEPTPTPTPVPTVVNFAQMLAIPYEIDSDSVASAGALLNFIETNNPGFVVLFGDQISTASATEAITDVLNQTPEEKAPLLAVDHEGGRVQRLNGQGFTRLPTWKRICEQTEDQRHSILATSAAELKDARINIVFAPVIDVAESNLILRDRICSGDPELVGDAALDFIDEFQNQNILSVIKHYPGLGSATVDTHTDLGSVTVTATDVLPFKTVLDRYPEMGVMTAHIAVENQSANIPCSLSVSCVSQLYDLYPDVVVFSDALEMAGARYNTRAPEVEKSLATVAVEAVMAGNTVLVFGQDVSAEELDTVLTRMKLEYTNSSEFRDRVNNSITKIKKLREQYLPVSDKE